MTAASDQPQNATEAVASSTLRARPEPASKRSRLLQSRTRSYATLAYISLATLVPPTTTVVMSATIAGVAHSLQNKSIPGPSGQLLIDAIFALSAIAKTLSVIALLSYTSAFISIIFTAYINLPQPSRDIGLSRATRQLSEVQKQLVDAQRDLQQTEEQRKNSERLLALSNEQIEAVRSQIGQDVRRSGRWPLVIGIAGLLVAVAGVAISFALAP